MNKQGDIPMPIGASSLLTIFAILCLLIFSLLSLSTANANRKLSDKSAEAITKYYKADFEAEQMLSQLRTGIVPDGVKETADGIYSYVCKISDTKHLSVEIMLDSDSYQIKKWKVVSDSEWEVNDTIKVWDGQIED